MGASIAHLLIYNFNVTRMEVNGKHYNIDLADHDPIRGALSVAPLEKVLTTKDWKSTDTIIQVVQVPVFMHPVGYVLNKEISKDMSREQFQAIVARKEVGATSLNTLEDARINTLIYTALGKEPVHFKFDQFKLLIEDKLPEPQASSAE